MKFFYAYLIYFVTVFMFAFAGFVLVIIFAKMHDFIIDHCDDIKEVFNHIKEKGVK